MTLRILTDEIEESLVINPIDQTQKHEKLSDKYQLIRTDKLIEVFQDNGLEIVGKSFAGVRDNKNLGFQKHLIAFSSNNLQTNDGRMQLLLTNSHNGSCSYRLDLGFFRTVCANGLVSGTFESQMRIRHTKNALDKLDDAVRYQLDRLPLIAAEIDEMKQIQLSNQQIAEFTLEAAKLRADGNVKSVFDVNHRRSADYGSDLWKVLNRLQEAIIRGGLRYTDLEGELKRSRKVSSVDTVMKLNKGIWQLANEYKKAA